MKVKNENIHQKHKQVLESVIYIRFNLNIAQAQQLGTKIVDEDGMLDLIRTLPGKRSKYEVAAEKEASKVKTILIYTRTCVHEFSCSKAYEI